MTTYRLVRRRRPTEPSPESALPEPVAAPPPAPLTPAEPARNLWVGYAHYGPNGAQCARCGVDRQDSGGMTCTTEPAQCAGCGDQHPGGVCRSVGVPNTLAFGNTVFTIGTATYRQDDLGVIRSVSTGGRISAEHLADPVYRHAGDGTIRSVALPSYRKDPPKPGPPKTLLEYLDEDD